MLNMDTRLQLATLLCIIWISQVTFGNTISAQTTNVISNETKVASSVAPSTSTTTQGSTSTHVTSDLGRVTTRQETTAATETMTTTMKACQENNGWMYSTIALGICFGLLAIMFTIVVIVFLVRASGDTCSCGYLGSCTEKCCGSLSTRLLRPSRNSESTAVMLSRQSIQDETLSQMGDTCITNDEIVTVTKADTQNAKKEKIKGDVQWVTRYGKTNRKTQNPPRSSDGTKSQTVNNITREQTYTYGNTKEMRNSGNSIEETRNYGNTFEDTHNYGNTTEETDKHRSTHGGTYNYTNTIADKDKEGDNNGDDDDDDDEENIYELPGQEKALQVDGTLDYRNSTSARNSKDEDEDDYMNSTSARNSKDEEEDDDSTNQMYCPMSTSEDHHDVNVHLGEHESDDSEQIYVNY